MSLSLFFLGGGAKPVVLVNATFDSAIPVLSSVAVRARTFDVVGREKGDVAVGPGVTLLKVPVSGYAELMREFVGTHPCTNAAGR